MTVFYPNEKTRKTVIHDKTQEEILRDSLINSSYDIIALQPMVSQQPVMINSWTIGDCVYWDATQQVVKTQSNGPRGFSLSFSVRPVVVRFAPFTEEEMLAERERLAAIANQYHREGDILKGWINPPKSKSLKLRGQEPSL